MIYKADENNIIININERYNNFNSPLSLAIKKDNIEMIKVFIDYTENHNICLIITNDDKKDKSKINSEIIDLIEQYNAKRIRKPSSSCKKGKNDTKSYQSSNLPNTSFHSQTPSLTESQSELLTSLLSQPPDVIMSILTQLQSNLQLLQNQPRSFETPSPLQASLSLRPTAPPMYDNGGDLPSYNEIDNSNNK